MSPELEERIYNVVLRTTLWDSDHDEAAQMLQANGITGPAAEQMFDRARVERIALIRSEGFQRTKMGVLLVAGGVMLFYGSWFGMGFILRPVLIGSGLFVALGLWRAVTGLVDAALAPKRKGSVVED